MGKAKTRAKESKFWTRGKEKNADKKAVARLERVELPTL